MARWFGFTLRKLRDLDSAACDTDARLAWRDGEPGNLQIVVAQNFPGGQPITALPSFSGSREIRLLGLQLLAHAAEMERDEFPYEVVLE